MVETFDGDDLFAPVNASAVDTINGRAYAFWLVNIDGFGHQNLWVVDANSPAEPPLADSSTLGAVGTFGGSQRLLVRPGAPQHELVYVFGAGDNSKDLLVFDVDFSNPTIAISLLGNQADLFQGNGTSDAALYNDYLLVVERNTGVWVIDVSDPANIHSVGSLPNVFAPNSIEVVGDKAYVSDLQKGLIVFDCTPLPDLPVTYLNSFWVNDWAGYLEVKAAGARVYVYLPNGNLGLRILDASDPMNIQQVVSTGSTGGYDIAAYIHGGLVFESSKNMGIYAFWAPIFTETTLLDSVQMLDSSAIDGVTYQLNGSSPSPVTLLHMPVYSGNVPAAPSGAQFTGHTFAVYARDPNSDQPVTTLTGTYTLEVGYTPEDIAGLNETTLSLFWWDGTQWVREASTVDPAANTVSATPNHFSLWALIGYTDATPPTGSLTINAGDLYTAARGVTLGMTSDADTTLMRFNETTSGCSGTSCDWTAWIENAPTYAFTLSAGDGLKTVEVQFQDGAGNYSTGTISHSITLDTTPPTGYFTITQTSPTNQSAVDLTISATDGTHGTDGLDQMRFSQSATFASDPAWIAYGTSASFGLTGGDGFKTIYAQFKDKAGNVSDTEIAQSIILDQTAPTGSLYINAGAAVTTTNVVSLTLAVSDNLSGPAQMHFSTTGSFSSADWVDYAAASTFTLPAGDGLKSIYAQVSDAAGNISTVEIKASITLDTTPPTGSVSFNPSQTYTTVTAVDLALTASGAADMRLSNSSEFPGADANWKVFNTAQTWTLASGDGSKTVFAQFRDDHGLISAVYSDSILLDTTKPVGQLYLNGGAELTRTAAVSLFITFTETGSGVAQYRAADTTAALATAAWKPLANPASYTLPGGDGLKTVYIQLSDGAGNLSDVFSDTITLDSTAPTGSIVINSGAATTTRTAVVLTLTASDTISPAADLQMLVSNDSAFTGAVWQLYQPSLNWTLLPGLGSRSVYVRFRDASGNETTGEIKAVIVLNVQIFIPAVRR